MNITHARTFTHVHFATQTFHMDSYTRIIVFTLCKHYLFVNSNTVHIFVCRYISAFVIILFTYSLATIDVLFVYFLIRSACIIHFPLPYIIECSASFMISFFFARNYSGSHYTQGNFLEEVKKSCIF